jgi:Terminase RNaseH-like domain
VGRPRKSATGVGKLGKTGTEDNDWQQQRNDLTEVGKLLDEITPEKDWERNDKGEVVWKPTFRDNWIETKLKIRTKAGKPIFFQLNPVQREYSRVCLEKQAKQNIVLKARQIGMTSYIAARFFVQTITRPGTLTMLVGHDRLAAEEIFRIVRRFWDNLVPERWKKGALKTSHSSARELVFPRLDSEFTVASADENAGRGRTIQNLHCTEVSRWGRDGEEALASLRAAVVPGGEIVLESTANGAWGSFYQEWQLAEETGYTQHFFPWWYEESYRIETGPSFEMTTEEAELAAVHGLKPEQIAWRRHQWAALRGLAAQEFAEDAVACFRASGECVFELEVVERALEMAGEPLEMQDNGRLAIWLPPRPGVEYVVGVDPAGGGVNGDYSCAQVIDRKLGMQCAEMHGHFTLRELARKLVELGKEYNSALMAVERNNHGAGVLAHLERLSYPTIYEEKGWNGWNTTAASRPAMIETLMAVMMEKPELFRSARLWNECRTFVRTANGRPEAAPGSHDDCVMAMGIALAVREAEAGKKAGQPSAVSHQPSGKS